MTDPEPASGPGPSHGDGAVLARVLGIGALVFPALVALGIGMSTALAPWFRWSVHPLSQLGGRPPMALVFNSFLSISGVLLTALAVGLFVLAGRIGAPQRLKRSLLVLTVGGIALSLVGVFTVHTRPPHLVVAGLFFILTSVALVLFGRALRRAGAEGDHARFGTVSIALGSVTFILWPCWLLVWTAWAIPEVVSVVAYCSWAIILGWRLVRAGPAGLWPAVATVQR